MASHEAASLTTETRPTSNSALRQDAAQKKPRRLAGARFDGGCLRLWFAGFCLGIPHAASLCAISLCLCSRHVRRKSGRGKGERKPQGKNHRNELTHAYLLLKSHHTFGGPQ